MATSLVFDASSSPVISARELTKTYRFHEQGAGLWSALRNLVRRRYQTRLAVDRVDFSVGRGEVVGLLGPNGAGKTTTLKLLSGLLYPTGGELEVLGFEPSRRQADYLRRISLVMGQKTMLWWDVPAMDTFLLHKEMYDLGDAEFDASVSELADLLDVADLLHVQVRKCSLGERMKLELMAALVHRPEVLFLDEPTIGLDVVAKARVRSFVRDINRLRGTTIVLTSHDMDDIEALCERLVIIDHGRIWYDGELAELVRQARPRKRVRVTYAEPVSAEQLGGLDALHPTYESDLVLRFEVERSKSPDLLESLPRSGPVVDIDVSDAGVEEIVRDLFAAGLGVGRESGGSTGRAGSGAWE